KETGGVEGGLPTPSKSPRSRDWKTAVDDSEQRFFAAAAYSRDSATSITPVEAREMAKRSGRTSGERRQLPSSPGDPFESWGRKRAGSLGGAEAGIPSSSKGIEGFRGGGGSRWGRDDVHQGPNANATAATAVASTPPSDALDREHSGGPHAPSHTTPSPATSSDVTDAADEADADADADDTLQAAASLVSFQKPRASEAPRLRGPLGTSALRVTLGTPVVSTGAPSIGSSVQAKLSLPRTAATPGVPSLPAEIGGKSAGDPLETAYRAAGLEVGSSGGGRGSEGEGGQGSGAGSKAGEARVPSLNAARNGMFDAVSPTAPVEESGTPYSVCRVNRGGRPDTTAAAAPSSAGHEKEDGSRDAKAEPKEAPSTYRASAAPMGAGSTFGSTGEPLCRTPLKKRPTPGRESAGAPPGSAARVAGWSGSGAGPWATPPPMAMGTPCSGSRFRSADDEESDYSDYETYCSVKPTPLKRVLTPPSATKRLFADIADADGGLVRRRIE
ncbi:unnamed protein product, partial [Hapterophycus canaliculatus]